MKKIVIQLVFVLFYVSVCYSQSDASSNNNSELIGFKSKCFMQLTIQSGFINPVSPSFVNYYYTCPNLGCDLAYRINTEVALYGEMKYDFLSTKDTSAPSSGYFEMTAGARYYIRPVTGRSSFYLETGLGPYIFIGGTSPVPNQLYDSQTKFRLGANAGIGGEFVITNSLFLTLRSKMNLVFDSKGGTTYLSCIGGISFRL